MRLSSVGFFGTALIISVAAACSSSSSDDSAAAAGDQDAGDPSDVDAGAAKSDASTAALTKEGDVCTATGKCSPGQECMTLSQHGGVAICLNSCAGKNTCPGTEECQNEICTPTCSGRGCPSAMECISDLDQCVFDCDHYPALCGAGESCSMSVQCVPTVPDAGPPTCKSGGGTATSGVTGSKTVGSLTSTEQATFCDWAAAVTGGYNCEEACDGGIDVSFSSSQSVCISQFTKSGCAATVSDVEACVKANAANVCSLAILNSPSCASLRACE